jgi:hypothetical protein
MVGPLVAQRHLDVELRERLLHEPRVGHQFLLRLGRLDGLVRVLEEIHRRQLVVANHRRGSDGDGLLLQRRAPGRDGVVGDFDVLWRRRRGGCGFEFIGFLLSRPPGTLSSIRWRGGGFVHAIVWSSPGLFLLTTNLLRGFRALAQDVGGGRGGEFLRGNHFTFQFALLDGRLFNARLRGFARAGVRDAQVAHGGRGHRAAISAQAGFLALLRFVPLHLLLQPLRLLLQIAGAPGQYLFLGRQALVVDFILRRVFARFEDHATAQPRAELEVGQEDQADGVERAKDDGGARLAEMAEDQAVHDLPEISARAGRVDVLPQRLQVVGVEIKEAEAGDEQHRRPGPTPLEVAQELEQVAQAEEHQQHRQHERAAAEALEQQVGDVRPRAADQVVRGLVGWEFVRAHVAAIKRKLRDQQQQRRGDEHDADDVAKAAVLLRGVLRVLPSHAIKRKKPAPKFKVRSESAGDADAHKIVPLNAMRTASRTDPDFPGRAIPQGT